MSFYPTTIGSAGSLSVSSGNTAVTGSGTSWANQVYPGDKLYNGSVFIGHVASVASNTSLTLRAGANATLSSSTTWQFSRDSLLWHSTGLTNDLMARLQVQWSAGIGITPDASGTLAQRASYNAAAQGFRYLRTDVNPFELYAKASATSGDWAGSTTLQGATGLQGVQGIQGIQGLTGATGIGWVAASGVPSSGVGATNDYGLNASTGVIYQKIAGTWTSTGLSIKGPQGDTGPQGPAGDAADYEDNAALAALAALTPAANKLAYFTGSTTAALTDLSSAGRALIDDADASAQRTTLGVVIGTHVQAQNARLQDIASNLSGTSGAVEKTGANTFGTFTVSTAGKALIDDADAAAQRTTLGLGTVSTLASDTDGTLAANSDSVIATQKAVKTYADTKAPLASPALTGTPTAPTASPTTNTTQIATTAMVQSAIAAYVAAQDVQVFKGVIDCSANPNYPAADAGHTYRVSVAGKIGGGSGANVEQNDQLICLADGTSAGTQAAVGSSWFIVQANIDGAVIGPASVTDSHVAQFDGTTGKLIKGGKAAPSGDFVGTSDTQTLTNKTLTSPSITTPTGITAGDVSAVPSSYLDTDGTLAANSDTKVATQKAVKTYADTKLPASYLDTDVALAADSDTKIASQKATKTYADTKEAKANKGMANGYAPLDALGKLPVPNLPDVLWDRANLTKNAITATATDIVWTFTYDTRRDSDGGAWATQGFLKSWYTETLGSATRGTKREFPTVAEIVLRSGTTNTLGIYDATDLDGAGASRMWKIIARSTGGIIDGTPTSVFALNGRIYVTTSTGLYTLDFANDQAFRRDATDRQTWSAGIAAAGSYGSSSASGAIVNTTANHVHALVYPGALLGSSGLAIPKVAVGTAGGVSVIHEDSAVYDLVYSGGGFQTAGRVALSPDGRVHFHAGASFAPAIASAPIPYADVSTTLPPEQYTATAFPAVLQSASGITSRGILSLPDGTLVTGNAINGLTLVAREASSPGSAGTSMVSYAAINYATGWQVGDVRGAYLCDNATGSITASAELVTNGDFATDITGWNTTSPAGGSSVAFDSGRIAITTDGTNGANARQAVTTVAGQTYLVSFDQIDNSVSVVVGTAEFGAQLFASTLFSGAGTKYLQFTATSTTSWIQFTSPTALSQTSRLDNISVRLAVGDRSYKAKPMRVYGTLSCTAVASGADLVWFSGWSGSDYLEQPYITDMNFANADFCVGPIFFKRSATAALETLIMRDSATTGARFGLQIASTTSVLNFVASDGTDTVTVSSPSAVDDDLVHCAIGIMRGTTMELWIDNVLVASGSASAVDSISNTSAVLRIGLDCQGSNAFGGSIALVRLSATAPTPAQIARMYRDEAPLFQANAKAVLGGTSNAVATMDYDRERNTLIVGTADGVSEFVGLARSAYWDTSNTTLTNDNMKGVSSRSGFRLMAGGAQAVAKREQATIVPQVIPETMYLRTTDATPALFAPRIHVSEGQTVRYTVAVNAVLVSTGALHASYQIGVVATRAIGGNVSVTPTVTVLYEANSSMDATAAAQTTPQTAAIQVTGLAATTLLWSANIVGGSAGIVRS